MANLSNINNKFLVTTGGNVGIGNTSPTLSTLTVGIGSTNSPSQICQLAGSGSGVYSVLSLTNTNGTAADNNGVGLDFHVNAAYSATGRIQLIHPTAQSGTTTNSSMQFLTYGTVSGVTTFSPRMTIDYRGNVGIGTTSPAALLDVSSGTTTDVIRFGADSRWGFSRANSDNRYLSFMRNQNGSGTAVWTVDGDNGNVGIGTTAPNQEGFGAANIALSVKAPTSGGVANLELIGLGNADNDELGYVNFMSQAATDSAAAIVGLRHTSDTSGKLSFRTAGSERMRITETGNVGIGTTSPQNILHLKSNDPKLILEDGNAGSDEKVYAIYPAGSQYVLQTQTDAFGAGQNVYVVDRTGTAVDTHKWYTANTERMRITSGGEILIGTQTITSAGKLQLTSSNAYYGLVDRAQVSDSGNPAGFFNSAGSLVGYIGTNNSSTTYHTSSDYRLKEDLKEFNGLDIVSQIKTYDFKWKSYENRSYGVMAHELQEVIPDAVAGEKDLVNEDGSINPQGVDYSKIVPLLVKSIQELEARVKELENK